MTTHLTVTDDPWATAAAQFVPSPMRNVPDSAVVEAAIPPASGDLKIGRRGLKPPLHWVPMWALQGVARVFDDGARKYARGNWVKAAQEPQPERALEDYISAAQRHYGAIQQGGWAAIDPESGLPHVDHLLCSLVMLRGIGQLAGVLPADPGQGNNPRAK